jgi:DNA-binding HxlR family transcriptional regulator
MRRTRFDTKPCPIARTTDLMGDWWTPMVLRQVAYRQTRFEQIQETLGCSRATLTERLNRLVDEGMLQRVAYQDNPTRFEYTMTKKGLAFFDVLAAMWRFGEDWLFEGDDRVKVEMIDSSTGEVILPQVINANTGNVIDPLTVKVRRKRKPLPPSPETSTTSSPDEPT